MTMLVMHKDPKTPADHHHDQHHHYDHNSGKLLPSLSSAQHQHCIASIPMENIFLQLLFIIKSNISWVNIGMLFCVATIELHKSQHLLWNPLQRCNMALKCNILNSLNKPRIFGVWNTQYLALMISSMGCNKLFIFSKSRGLLVLVRSTSILALIAFLLQRCINMCSTLMLVICWSRR